MNGKLGSVEDETAATMVAPGAGTKFLLYFIFFFLLRDGSAREHERIRCIYNASIVPVSR